MCSLGVGWKYSPREVARRVPRTGASKSTLFVRARGKPFPTFEKLADAREPGPRFCGFAPARGLAHGLHRVLAEIFGDRTHERSDTWPSPGNLRDPRDPRAASPTRTGRLAGPATKARAAAAAAAAAGVAAPAGGRARARRAGPAGAAAPDAARA